MLIYELIKAFIKIGAFSFGGGYAVLSFIQKEIIDTNHWISPAEFVDIVAIAEMTPGPIAVNSSTFVGYKLYGIFGGILCTLCVLLVPFTLSLLVSIYFNKFKDNVILKKALNGIRPAVLGLIAASCFSIAKISIDGIMSILFFITSFILVYKFKINPIYTLLISGVLGVLVYGFIVPLV